MRTPLVCAGTVLLALVAQVRAQPQTVDRLEAMMIATDRDREIPLVEERLTVAIDGQHATSTLQQVFQIAGSGPVEGRYQLRPGMGSHVEGFAYWNGEQKIVGEVFERQTARRVYENVTTRRRDPGLLEADGEGAFAFKVFPIQPNEKKRIELQWTKWLDRRAQTVTYRAPITRGDAEIVVEIAAPLKNLRSPSHRFHIEKTATGVRARSDGAKGSGEFVLEWDADEPEWTPSAYVQGGGKDEGWFALSLAAPKVPQSAVAAKDVTIVIDRSGSMIGDPIEHAKAAAANMVRILDAGDRVNVITFSDEVDPLFKTPQTLDPQIRSQAIAFIDRVHDGGGTDIALALSTAIANQDARSGRPRVIVFLTDGQSDVDRAIAAAKADTGDVRLFTLGLGKDVNRPLLQRLAAQKRGRFTYIENAKQIEPEVGRLAASIAKPLLVDVSVEVDGANAVRLYPRSLSDLFAEDQLLVTGRLRGNGTAKFTIKGKLAGKPVAFTRAVDLARAPQRPWVARLWAQSRVEHLLEELSLGANAPEMQNEVIELALAYNFVTPYTAFLAIPESELGAERNTVMAARERKAKILAANPDAASVSKDKAKGGQFADQKRGFGGDDEDDDIAANKRKRSHRVSDDASEDPQGEAPRDVAERDRPMTSKIDSEGGNASPTGYAAVHKHSSCAGCASGSADGSLALVAFALIVLRRRRARYGMSRKSSS